jgi:threonine dehydrogenase-like Zn-dependent dehydrogenase
MCAEMSFMNGAKRVIVIDGGAAAWRLDFLKEKLPKIETINYTDLPKGENVVSRLKKMEHGGPDVALECAAGEYAKSIAHKLEMLIGAETDTSELVNEMIESVKSFGRCGITGVYVGYVSLLHRFRYLCTI